MLLSGFMKLAKCDKHMIYITYFTVLIHKMCLYFFVGYVYIYETTDKMQSRFFGLIVPQVLVVSTS